MASKLLLSGTEQQALLKLARQSLDGLYTDNHEKILTEFEQTVLPHLEGVKEKLPCFVTLLTNKDQLRGCIGNTKTDAPLYENVFLYTRFAALEDPRFDRVEPGEIKTLQIEISVLGPLHSLAIQDIDSISIGKHGLVVRSGNRSGLLLAKVATEHGWTPRQFLSHTCEKAGLPAENVSQYNLSYFEELSF